MAKGKNKENKGTVASRIDKSIKQLKDNDFTLYFFVVDCKGIPNSSIGYIYELAKTLYNQGFNVKMIYQLADEYTKPELYKLRKQGSVPEPSKQFVGVKDWLGNEYASLPHLNIATQEWSVSPSDFLFIPEALSSLMFETYKHKLPCKRYVILQNYNYVSEFIPLGVEWKNYGIFDAIAISDSQANKIKEVFPYMRTSILPPVVNDVFRKPIKPKKLVVNIITKDPNDVNRVIKPFYWKYPMYKFISFRELRNIPREQYADYLKEGIATVWVDRDTSFGYAPLEAMRCDNIVIGKIPEDMPEWMYDEEGIINNALWVYNINDIPDVLAKAVGSWMRDEIPSELLDEMGKTNQKYHFEEWDKNVERIFEGFVEERIQSFEEIKNNIAKNEGNNE